MVVSQYFKTNSMRIELQKHFFFTLAATMYVSLMEQLSWPWICFDFCLKFTPYFGQNIYVIILE